MNERANTIIESFATAIKPHSRILDIGAGKGFLAEEMARVGKPGGIVALVDNVVPPDKQTAGYINHFEKLRDPSHNWAYPIVRLEAYFADAHLKVIHTESFKKEMEFEAWADRQGASKETKTKLRALLNNAPASVRAFLTPRRDGDKMFFALTEAIVIGRKIEAVV